MTAATCYCGALEGKQYHRCSLFGNSNPLNHSSTDSSLIFPYTLGQTNSLENVLRSIHLTVAQGAVDAEILAVWTMGSSAAPLAQLQFCSAVI